jgi:hypothetical protein
MAFNITQAKSILSSKTFYGSLLGLTSVLFPSFYAHLMAAIGISDPTAVATKIVGAVGAAFAIYGRFAAVQHVTLTGGPVLVPTAIPLAGGGESTTVKKLAMVETTTTITPVEGQPKA